MGIWLDKSAVAELSSANKLMVSQSGVTKTCDMTDIDAYVSGLLKETVYGYMSTSADTVMTTVDTYYVFQGIFTNTIAHGFSASASGIEYTGTGGDFEVEFKTDGYSGSTAILHIALVLNGTFDVNGKMLTGTVLPGSEGGCECLRTAGASGFGSPKILWAGTLANADLLTLVIKSDTGATTWTPHDACATIHKLY